MISAKTLRVRTAAPINRARNVRARGIAEEVKSTVEPRVQELREKQLSTGLTSVTDVMSFNGPLPELVNGRLAMLGFFSAICAECTSQESAFQQFKDAPGAVIGISALFVLASLIPIIRGSAVLDDGAGEGLRFGSFNVTNELVNGRAAMLGLSILLLYEGIAHAPLF